MEIGLRPSVAIIRNLQVNALEVQGKFYLKQVSSRSLQQAFRSLKLGVRH
jgi:hypothetical protein